MQALRVLSFLARAVLAQLLIGEAFIICHVVSARLLGRVPTMLRWVGLVASAGWLASLTFQLLAAFGAFHLLGATLLLTALTAAVLGTRGDDKRDYRVNFDKINSKLPGFKCKYNVAMGARQLELLAPARMHDFHLAHELAAANAQEGDAIAMLGIEIGLNLEDEARELRTIDRDRALIGVAGVRGRAELQEAAQEVLDAVVVECAAEEHGLRSTLFRGTQVGIPRASLA